MLLMMAAWAAGAAQAAIINNMLLRSAGGAEPIFQGESKMVATDSDKIAMMKYISYFTL